MSDALINAMRITARAAWRNRTLLTDLEVEAALIVLIEAETEIEAAAAEATLFHLREEKKAKRNLDALLDGIGGERKAGT